MLRLAAIAAELALASTGANATVLECTAQSSGSWQNGDLSASYIASDDPGGRTFTVDFDTGVVRLNATDTADAIEATYEVLSPGSVDDDVDFIAFHRGIAALLRIRMANTEYQFIHDYGRTLDAGTCSVVTP
jgi:hypothetical protein